MAPASGTGRADRKFDEGFDTMLSRLSPIFSILVVCVLAVTAVPERAAALAPDAARDFIKNLGKKAGAVFADPSIDQAKRRRELHRLFVQGFDTRTIGRFVLGRHWDAASEQQLEEYLALFETFAVQSYAPRLGDYAGNRLQVKEARVLGTNGDIIVSSVVAGSTGKPIRLDWRVRVRGEGYKIVDVIVDGVSMLLTQRDEFASVIRASGDRLEGLLTALRQRTATY
jgi:phospholipid transport system substrate-binding protein